MKSKKPKAKITTIAIYNQDWKKLNNLAKKGETFRDIISKLIKNKEKKKNESSKINK